MKYFGIVLLAIVWLCSGCAQLTLKDADEHSFSIESPQTGERYEISILLPAGYSTEKSYPSVYLIDGHWHYLYTAAAAKRLMEQDKIEDVILIGIAYDGLAPNTLGGFSKISELRIDDLTFPKNVDTDSMGGKAFEFRSFLADNLIPIIEEQYATSSERRTLMGHSLGGYFGIWEMFTFPDSSLFTQIEAGSPALWWADGYLMEQEAALSKTDQPLPFDLHTTMGSLESVTWNTFFDEFEERLETSKHPELRYVFERYPKGHTANAEEGFRQGLLYFFGR
ncbi:MAG: alpha/beta hydrolase-fold protein [Bacteroidota bacterium]